MVLTGCATGPVPPVYRKEELKARCERTGGVAPEHTRRILRVRGGRADALKSGTRRLRGDDREGERGWEPTTRATGRV
jgi:hypothetical protein